MVTLLAHRVEDGLTCRTDVAAAKDIASLYFRRLLDSITPEELQEKYFRGKEQHEGNLEDVDLKDEMKQEAMDIIVYTLAMISKEEIGKLSDSERFNAIRKLNEESSE